eukprot:6802448-Lingulodinium_polyedra.AAC.1
MTILVCLFSSGPVECAPFTTCFQCAVRDNRRCGADVWYSIRAEPCISWCADNLHGCVSLCDLHSMEGAYLVYWTCQHNDTVLGKGFVREFRCISKHALSARRKPGKRVLACVDTCRCTVGDVYLV